MCITHETALRSLYTNFLFFFFSFTCFDERKTRTLNSSLQKLHCVIISRFINCHSLNKLCVHVRNILFLKGCLISGKHEVPMTFEFRRKLKDIDRSWAAYLELLASCQVTLHEKKVLAFKKRTSVMRSRIFSMHKYLYLHFSFTTINIVRVIAGRI